MRVQQRPKTGRQRLGSLTVGLTVDGEPADLGLISTLVRPSAIAAQAIATARATARPTVRSRYFKTDARGASIVACIFLVSPLQSVCDRG
jgi:hypothetical protein